MQVDRDGSNWSSKANDGQLDYLVYLCQRPCFRIELQLISLESEPAQQVTKTFDGGMLSPRFFLSNSSNSPG